MLVDVPEPVWKMSTTNWSSSFPSITSLAAASIALPRRSSTTSSATFTWAAIIFIAPSARMKRRGNRSPLTGKFSTARWVDAP